MKKTILIALLLLVSCSTSYVQVNDGPLKISIPSNWKTGSIGNQGSGVWMKIYSKANSNSLESVFSEIERTIIEPARYKNNDGTIGYKGKYLPLPQIYVKAGKTSLTYRDLEIETKRIEQTDSASNASPQDIAKLNIREMALVYDQAISMNLTPTDMQVKDDMQLSLDQVKKMNLSKEQFLYNWGITEYEFECIIRQKLAYEAVIKKFTEPAKNEQEYVKLATQFKNNLLSSGNDEVFELELAQVFAIVIESNDFIITAIGFGSGYDLGLIAKSVKIDGNFIDGQSFYFGESN
jgi:hypothetical protein